MAGKTVVITGASSGIGLETARALAAMGARIVAVVRNRAKTEAWRARDDASARRLWELSEQLCGVTWS